MPAFHMFNCMTLAFGPYALVWYRAIADQDLLSLVLWSGVLYGLTQIVIGLAMATFLTPPEKQGEFHLLHEIGRTLISSMNLGGMFLTLSTKTAKQSARHLRPLGTGFGWAAANSLLGTAGPLIYSSVGTEFNSKNIDAALGCTVTLLATLALVTFVEKARRDGFNLVHIFLAALLLCQSSCSVYLSSVSVASPIQLFVGNVVLGWISCYVAGVKLGE
jgi:hypothetical protein